MRYKSDLFDHISESGYALFEQGLSLLSLFVNVRRKLLHYVLNFVFFVILSVEGEPTNVLIRKELLDLVLNACVICGILVFQTVNVENIIPQEMSLCMRFKIVTLLLHLSLSEKLHQKVSLNRYSTCLFCPHHVHCPYPWVRRNCLS